MALRPHVTLKIATSLDGKIALANGQSEWITGEKSREAGRRLRGQNDAIAVGANTAVLDNPQLTTRLQGLDNPIRVIFDSRLRTSAKSNLVLTARETPVWIYCYKDATQNVDVMEAAGVKIFAIERDMFGLKIETALEILKSNGVDRLLLEGGGQLTASFLKQDAVDIIEWFRAPIILGGDGRNGIGDLGLEDLSLSKRFSRNSITELGDDLHEQYLRR